MTGNQNSAKKSLDSWSEVFIVDPLVDPFTEYAAKLPIQPIHITLIAVGIGLTAVTAVLYNQFLFAGGFLFVSILLDGLDGKVARMHQHQIVIHAAMDQLGDQLVFIAMLLAIYITVSSGQSLVILFIGMLYLYEVVYALRISISTSPTRSADFKTQDLREKYEWLIEDIRERFTSTIVLHFINIIDSIHQIGFRFRTFPYPKINDTRFVLLIYLLYPNDLLLGVMSIFLIPDLMIGLGLLSITVWAQS